MTAPRGTTGDVVDMVIAVVYLICSASLVLLSYSMQLILRSACILLCWGIFDHFLCSFIALILIASSFNTQYVRHELFECQHTNKISLNTLLNGLHSELLAYKQ